MKLLAVTAKPTFEIAGDSRTIGDEDGNFREGYSEYLILTVGERRLRIPWRILESDDRTRPRLSTEETYTFELDDDDPPHVLKVLLGKTLIYERD